MPNRKGTGAAGKSSGRGHHDSRTTQPARTGPDIVIVQPRQRGALGQFAGTAAGVAAGTVIGDKITGRSDPPPQSSAGSPESSGPCVTEQQHLLDCAETQNDLRACEPLQRMVLDCKRKYNIR